MPSRADGLPPEFAKQIHPDWRKNEAAYWVARDQLVGPYQGQWIAFADGKVIASGRRPVEVSHAARRVGAHAFIVCVGHENEPFRIRRAAYPYDVGYVGEPLPVIRPEFRTQPGISGQAFDRVILDTGADTSALPWSDCQQLQLDPTTGEAFEMQGVAGGSAPTLAFTIWVYLDGIEYSCQLLADCVGGERILGRDVLNSLDVLFRGPGREAVINP